LLQPDDRVRIDRLALPSAVVAGLEEDETFVSSANV